MAQIVSLDDIAAGARGLIPLLKTSLTSVAGQFQSLWIAAGFPGPGATPPVAGAGTTPSRLTAGSVNIPDITALQNMFVAAVDANFQTAGVLWIMDRLAATSGLNGTLTTAQAVTHDALTRWTTGEGVLGWLEVYTATGGTAATATISYTNSDGVAGRVGTASVPASANAGRLIPINLQAGDKGIRSIQTVTLSVSNATAGNFGVTLTKLTAIQQAVAAIVGQSKDAIAANLQEIQDEACLMLAILASTTSTGLLVGALGVTVK